MAPVQSGFLYRAGFWAWRVSVWIAGDWEGLVGVGRGCVEFCCMEWLDSFVPCGKVPEGKTCKDIETHHRADGSYPSPKQNIPN